MKRSVLDYNVHNINNNKFRLVVVNDDTRTTLMEYSRKWSMLSLVHIVQEILGRTFWNY